MIKGNIQIACGVILLAFAEIFMLQGVEPFASWFYPLAWWSYIFIIDGIIFRIQGNSLILSRRREFLVMIPWSVAFWLFFEMINLRTQNWYYINVIGNLWLRWVGYFISFATVLPGMFETYELLVCLNLYSKVKTRTMVFPKSWIPIFYLIGIIFLFLPLFFPRYCFPLIWLGVFFLLDPINYLHGSPSLMRDWEKGHFRRLLLLLTAGLICGFFWEFWNFWATSKWVYRVPFFEKFKIFEMPFAGFLGFPPFAVEAFVFYNFVSLFRFKRNWDKDGYLISPEKKLTKKALLVVAIIFLGFYVLAFHALDICTVKVYSYP
jgi:hypothetical protein